ncbi:flagellar hook-length control protein FliK [Glutamicibacter ardleyensis]|uniref:Flagellar hook-length control protein-like C-terminal domain-containing protein n=1 Tax=Glutamicibacter ardleyensis TaxID=225894 RepID=A0ABQ2DQZ2_9MICC|nr:flagellar hook-length control protein FliK [Glutamicibacter ardleyensis]GGJ69429.1 hypothetical protein GCM10007173_30220 [Glutamicibacter ardleyensis]
MIGNSQTSLGGVLAPAVSSVTLSSELLGTSGGHSAGSDAPAQLFTDVLATHLGALRPDEKSATAAPEIASGQRQSVLASEISRAGEQTTLRIDVPQAPSAVASGTPAAVAAQEVPASAVRSAQNLDIATNLLLRVAPGELAPLSNTSPDAGEDRAVSTVAAPTEQNAELFGTQQLEVAKSLMLRVESGTIHDLRLEQDSPSLSPILATPAAPDQMQNNALITSPGKESSLAEGFSHPGTDEVSAGREITELGAPQAIDPLGELAPENTALGSAPRQEIARPLDSARPQNFEPAPVHGNGTVLVAEAVIAPSAASRTDVAASEIPEFSIAETTPVQTARVSPSTTGEPEQLPAPVPTQAPMQIAGPARMEATAPASSIMNSQQVLTGTAAVTAAEETAAAVPATHSSVPQLITGDAPQAAPTAAAHAPRPNPVYPALHRQLIGPITTLVTEANGEKTISINVAPENLGPVTVKAHLGTEGLRLDVSAPTEAGREALRAMLPELRKELAATGGGQLNLASGEQSAQQQQHSGAQTPNPWGSRTAEYVASQFAGVSGEPAPAAEPPAQTGPAGSAQLDVIA